MMAFSGVRSSWLTAARNRLLEISRLWAQSVAAASLSRIRAISSLGLTSMTISWASSGWRINSSTKGR